MSLILKNWRGEALEDIAINSTLQQCIVGNDDALKIDYIGHDAQEATLIEFKGKVLLYYTMGYMNQTVGKRCEQIAVTEYNPETNTRIGETVIVANLSIFPKGNSHHYKASYFWVVGQYIYGVVTLWGDTLPEGNYVIMIKSTDGFNFQLVSDTIVDNVLPFEYTWWGNHCIIQVNNEFWWFIEVMVPTYGWQTYMLKSNNVEGSYQYVGKCELPFGGVCGGPRIHIHDGKLKMIIHYTTVPGAGTPTVLGWAETTIDNPLNWKIYYKPLLTYNTRQIFEYQDLIADPELAEIRGNTYMIASYVQNSHSFEALIWIWKCDGRLTKILSLNVPYPIN